MQAGRDEKDRIRNSIIGVPGGVNGNNVEQSVYKHTAFLDFHEVAKSTISHTLFLPPTKCQLFQVIMTSETS